MNSKIAKDDSFNTVVTTSLIVFDDIIVENIVTDVLTAGHITATDGSTIEGLKITDESDIGGGGGAIISAANVIAGIYIAENNVTVPTGTALTAAIPQIQDGQVVKLLVCNSIAGDIVVNLNAGITSPLTTLAIIGNTSRLLYFKKSGVGNDWILY